MDDIRREIERGIFLAAAGRGTIQKQFFDRFTEEHQSAIANEVIEAYNGFAAEMTRIYTVLEYGSKKLADILREEHRINVTERTVLFWLSGRGVTIRLPTRARLRLPRTTWEMERVREIEVLGERLEKCEKTRSDELARCEDTVHILRTHLKDLRDENDGLVLKVGKLTRAVETLKTSPDPGT